MDRPMSSQERWKAPWFAVGSVGQRSSRTSTVVTWRSAFRARTDRHGMRCPSSTSAPACGPTRAPGRLRTACWRSSSGIGSAVPTRIDRGRGAVTAEITDEERGHLRAMMGRFATGVSVVSARTGPFLAGMTANAIASVSIEPPLMLASVTHKSETHRAIIESHAFAVSVLAADQRDVAECFAQPITAAKLRRFCDAPWHEAETGSPILDGAIAFFD